MDNRRNQGLLLAGIKKSIKNFTILDTKERQDLIKTTRDINHS